MWVTKQLIADWVNSKMPILQEIFQIPSPSQAVFLCIIETHICSDIMREQKANSGISEKY